MRAFQDVCTPNFELLEKTFQVGGTQERQGLDVQKSHNKAGPDACMPFLCTVSNMDD